MAFVTAALIMGGATLIGGAVSANASSKASKTAANSANQATQLQREMWQQGRTDQAPWLAAGTNALAQMQDPSMAPQQWKNFSMADYQQDPGYQFRLSEGLKVLNRTASSRGGLLSGTVLRGAQRYGQDLASQEYDAAYKRYNTDQRNSLARGDMAYDRASALAGIGQTTASRMAGEGQTAANSMSQTGMAAGNATAAGQLGVGNSINNALTTGASSYQNQTNFNRWLAQQNGGSSGGGGGGGGGYDYYGALQGGYDSTALPYLGSRGG